MITLDSLDSSLHSVTVIATDLDIRPLTNVDVVTVENANLVTIASAVSGSEMQVDVVGSLPAGANTIGNVNIVGSVPTIPAGFTSWKVTAATVTSTESELVATPLASRSELLIQNLGTQDVFLGALTGVTTANGMKLPKGSSFVAKLDDSADIFAITASGSASLRVVEFAV